MTSALIRVITGERSLDYRPAGVEEAAMQFLRRSQVFDRDTNRALWSVVHSRTPWTPGQMLEISQHMARLLVPVLIIMQNEKAPAVSLHSLRHQPHKLVTQYGARAELTTEALTVFLEACYKRQWSGGSWSWASTDTERAAHSLLAHPACNASLLGTVWRTYVGIFGMSRNSRFDFLWSQNLPASVGARFLTFLGHYPLGWEDEVAPVWKATLSRDFPDLADLPERMAWDVAASQPIPRAWFQNAFPLQKDTLEHLVETAPGVKVADQVQHQEP